MLGAGTGGCARAASSCLCIQLVRLCAMLPTYSLPTGRVNVMYHLRPKVVRPRCLQIALCWKGAAAAAGRTSQPLRWWVAVALYPCVLHLSTRHAREPAQPSCALEVVMTTTNPLHRLAQAAPFCACPAAFYASEWCRTQHVSAKVLQRSAGSLRGRVARSLTREQLCGMHSWALGNSTVSNNSFGTQEHDALAANAPLAIIMPG